MVIKMKKKIKPILCVIISFCIILCFSGFTIVKSDNNTINLYYPFINGGMGAVDFELDCYTEDVEELAAIALENVILQTNITDKMFSEIPVDTKINAINFKNGALTIDFSSNFATAMQENNLNSPYICDTILYNMSQFIAIQLIQITFDGKIIEEIGGWMFDEPFNSLTRHITNDKINLQQNNMIAGERLSTTAMDSYAKIIYLDPGHGGSDPGAVGSDGTQEDDLNLSVALSCRSKLNSYGFTVYMTRTSDTTVSLNERCSQANNSSATAYISIHQNSATNTSASGCEIYYPSQTSYTGWVPNKQSLSKGLAESIITKLGKVINKRQPAVKSGNFQVIRNTKCVAVLIECAFISNVGNRDYMINNSYKVGQYIACGIADWYMGYH